MDFLIFMVLRYFNIDLKIALVKTRAMVMIVDLGVIPGFYAFYEALAKFNNGIAIGDCFTQVQRARNSIDFHFIQLYHFVPLD